MTSAKLSSEIKRARGKKNLSVTDLVSIDQLTISDIELIFKLTAIFKKFVQSGHKKTNLLEGKTIINFFRENSTRTRSSFELAGKHLGADVVNITSATSSAKKGEAIGDTARTLDALGTDCLIIRDSNAGAPFQVASLVGMPVINAGDGWHEHPTQALLEAFTLREKFGQQKLNYLFIGDALHSRVFGSQVRLYKKLGYKMRLAAPQTLIPKHVEKFGIEVVDIEQAFKGVDAIHAIRLQKERAAAKFIDSLEEYSLDYCITPEKISLAKKGAVVLHAGPVIRDFDVSTEVLESKNCLVQQMVGNGLPIRMAVEYLLIISKFKKSKLW